MPPWIEITALTLLAGMAMPAGALVAYFERIRPDWLETELRHAVIAFGGGALVSAVALVLVPEGMSGLPPWMVGVSFAGGGLAFMGLDVLLDSIKSPASQLAAMLSDFIPEALALGATFAAGSGAGVLLAGLIALQNVPEGVNAYRELVSSTALAPRRIIVAFFAMALLGPVAGLTGYFWLSAHTAVVSCIMLFAAGGILYLVFQDIAPQARLSHHWGPPLGAVAGFLLGILGKMITG